MRSFFALFFTSIVFVLYPSQTVDLSLKLDDGKEYKQTTISKSTITEDFQGQKINTVMTTGGTMSFLVKDITENGYDMDVNFEQISMSMQQPQGTVEFNSEKNDPNDMFSSIFRSIIGKPFHITMSKTGKVTDVKGIEVLWDSSIEKLLSHLSEMQKAQIRAQIAQAYGPKALKGSIEMVTAIYPENPVNKGSKWKIDTSLESGISINLSTEYEFAEMSSDYALIKGNSTVKTNDKDAYVQSNGMPLKYDLKGTMISDIKVDRNTGWIIEAKINQDIKGDAYIKENPQLPEGLKTPITVVNEMTVSN